MKGLILFCESVLNYSVKLLHDTDLELGLRIFKNVEIVF